MRTQRYPGRQRVLARQDMANRLYDAMVRSEVRNACTSPHVIAAIGLPSGILEPDKTPIVGEMAVRCRKCENCLKHRRRHWTGRAVGEILHGTRTWFITLTARPSDRFRMRIQAELDYRAKGWPDWSEWAEQDRFVAQADLLGQEATLWLKRIRKQAGARLRYLLVTEKHKDGYPHLHLLLHEQGQPVTKAILQQQWRLGFSHVKLVDDWDRKAAVYVCKYLAKDALTRVRASQKYGRPPLASLTEAANAVTAETLQMQICRKE